ncbi:hypothetical protein GCM10025858_31460 [Alicyclobacillus sacchari]|uniref:SpoIID/LytB domain-containing protein n=1 Tax=Alicyclobacillus sacchari TaxID=392010 RepID=UPI0023E9D588|nr:SpoIID/LytB domain-containing protein [Alicyclobacillus sacchari]GMA58643.1 hypothetical protein GCM10025858_31460 [Alicyclobacillus sacchari]
MKTLRRRSTMAAIGFMLAMPGLIAAPNVEAAQTIYNTSMPSVMRVAIRENNASGEPDPRGRIIYVQAVPFVTYCEDVLPNEWFPSWRPEALKGAMAVKMFAWYHHLHPVTIDGYTFDVDNTTNFQHFQDLSSQPTTNAAFAAIQNVAYTRPNGEIIELNYSAVTRMTQTGNIGTHRKWRNGEPSIGLRKGKITYRFCSSIIKIGHLCGSNRRVGTLPITRCSSCSERFYNIEEILL